MNDEPVSRKMVQICFANRLQLEAAQRFFCLINGRAFNTNVERLPLVATVGIINGVKTFPIAFSYCPSEIYESYMIYWKSLEEECFIARIDIEIDVRN
jgi:hypothetical protein